MCLSKCVYIFVLTYSNFEESSSNKYIDNKCGNKDVLFILTDIYHTFLVHSRPKHI